jgi:creatinine amidohydrolase
MTKRLDGVRNVARDATQKTPLVVELATLSWPEVEHVLTLKPVVMLPLGSTEQHGPALPLFVDSTLIQKVAIAAAERVAPQVAALVAPTMPYGCSHYHLGFPGTMSLPTGPYIATIEALCESLLGHGFQRLLLLNGHGGNHAPLTIVARNLHELWGVTVGVASYWNFAAKTIKRVRRSPPGGMSHACEFETSLMLHMAPNEVRQSLLRKEIPAYHACWHAMDFFDAEVVHVVEDTAAISPSGVIGDPTLATAAKGATIFEAIVDGIVRFLLHFSTAHYRSLPGSTNWRTRGKTHRALQRARLQR